MLGSAVSRKCSASDPSPWQSCLLGCFFFLSSDRVFALPQCGIGAKRKDPGNPCAPSAVDT